MPSGSVNYLSSSNLWMQT